MTSLPKRFRTVVFLTVVAAGWTLAVPPSHAGLRDTLKNVRDTVKCTSKAVLNPLRVVDWGMKNFEKLTSKEYERRANATMKEALAECGEAAKNIVARGFGVEKIVDKVSDTASRAKSAADTVSRWFGKGKKALDDGRRALTVSKRERPFYEKETGVLGRKSLPKVKRAEPSEARTGSGSASVWDSGPARDPGSGEGSRGRKSAWDAAPSRETDPWGDETEVAKQNPPAPVADEGPEADSLENDDWSAALSKVLGDAPRREAADDDYADALASLERRQAEERRLAEAERLRAEQEAELARQQAEREAQARREAEREAAYQAARATREARQANQEAWAQLGETLVQGAVTLYAARKGHFDPNWAQRAPSLPKGSSGSGWLPSLPERSSGSGYGSSPSYGSGSTTAPRSQDCEPPTPTCRQVGKTMDARVARIQARGDAGLGSMTQSANLLAEMYKVVLDHLPACIATETRPHCRADYQQVLEEFRRGYESARETAREASAGLRLR